MALIVCDVEVACGVEDFPRGYILSPSAVGWIVRSFGSLLVGYGFSLPSRLRSMPSHMTASCSFVIARLRSLLPGTFCSLWRISSIFLRACLSNLTSASNFSCATAGLNNGPLIFCLFISQRNNIVYQEKLYVYPFVVLLSSFLSLPSSLIALIIFSAVSLSAASTIASMISTT